MKKTIFLTGFGITALFFLSIIFSVNQSQAQVISWSTPPIDLSQAGQNADQSKVAVSPNGTKATAVWIRNDGANNLVQSASATISAGSMSWGTVSTLSTSGQDAAAPQISLSSDGTIAIAIWTRSNGSVPIVQSATASISGNVATWSSTTDLSAIGGEAYNPQVAISNDGTKASAIWGRYNPSTGIIQSKSATIASNVASWSSVTDISTNGQNAITPHIALSADGLSGTAIWVRNDGTSNITQSSSVTIVGNVASWGSSTDLSTSGQDAQRPQLDVSSDGTKAAAIWMRSNGSKLVIQSNTAAIAGTSSSWGTVTDLSASGNDSTDPQIACSSDCSNITAAWNTAIGSNNYIQVASATLSSDTPAWSSTTNLDDTGTSAFSPKIALSSDGSLAALVWYNFVSSSFAIQAKLGYIVGNSSSWGDVTTLSDSNHTASSDDVSISSDGTVAVAVWKHNDGSNTIAQADLATIIPPTPTPLPDQCPSDPNKTAPGICGCGVPDTDTDGNGVLQCFDPSTAPVITSAKVNNPQKLVRVKIATDYTSTYKQCRFTRSAKGQKTITITATSTKTTISKKMTRRGKWSVKCRYLAYPTKTAQTIYGKTKNFAIR